MGVEGRDAGDVGDEGAREEVVDVLRGLLEGEVDGEGGEGGEVGVEFVEEVEFGFGAADCVGLGIIVLVLVFFFLGVEW